jgi:hypothetical protein
MRRFISLAAALSAALILGACGSGGGSSSGSDNDPSQVESVIKQAVTSTDPADCTRLETQAYMSQIHFTSGPQALKACQQAAPDASSLPDSIDVTNVQVNGDRATADVVFHGGGFDGSTVSMALVKDGDQWKLDKITDIPHFDLAAFTREFTQRLHRDQGSPSQALDCITTQLNQAGPDNVKQALISGDSSRLLALVGPCLGGAAS